MIPFGFLRTILHSLKQNSNTERNLSNYNGTETHNHLVRKRTLNPLTKLAYLGRFG